MNRDWSNILYLSQGSEIQRKVYKILVRSRVLETLSDYSPVLAGTYPIGINLPDSDLDIICSFEDIDAFEKFLIQEYDMMDGFSLNKKHIRGQESLIARFLYEEFKFEIFGQSLPVSEQYAFRHMLIEDRILREKDESFRQKIIELKRKGLSTEEAFANILGINGDPYEGLLKLET